MAKEEQVGVPPMEVMRRLLDENRVLVRLLSSDPVNQDGHGKGPEPWDETDSANSLISAYQELLELLEILSATSAACSVEEVSGR